MYESYTRAAHMLLFADQRTLLDQEERFQSCAFCGKDLVVLPDDRRGGLCFDCLSLLGPEPAPCPECHAEIPAAGRRLGCSVCGWSPTGA